MRRSKLILSALAAVALIACAIVGPAKVARATTDGYDSIRQAFQSVGGVYTTSLPSLSTGEHNEFHLDSSGRLYVNAGAGVASGDVANDAADAGNPVKVGGKANAAAPSAVTEGDRVDASFDLSGRLRAMASGTAASGAAKSGNPVMVGGQDGTNAVTFLTSAGGSPLVAGDVANDGVDSGNPLKIGGIARNTWETAVSTAGDRVNASFDLYGRMRTIAGRESTTWYVVHTPAANNQATATKAAGAAGVKHVCTGFTWSLSSGAGAPTPELITIAIRDGATGAGTIIWQQTTSLPAVAGSHAEFGQMQCYLVGTAATAMTIETDSAPGANVVASVSITGEDISN